MASENATRIPLKWEKEFRHFHNIEASQCVKLCSKQ